MCVSEQLTRAHDATGEEPHRVAIALFELSPLFISKVLPGAALFASYWVRNYVMPKSIAVAWHGHDTFAITTFLRGRILLFEKTVKWRIYLIYKFR